MKDEKSIITTDEPGIDPSPYMKPGDGGVVINPGSGGGASGIKPTDPGSK